MAFDYSEIAGSVDEIMTEFGQTVTLTTVTAAGTYNKATGTIKPTTSTETGTGAVFEWHNRVIDGTTIRQGDRRLLLSPSGITAPAVNTTVTVGGVTYTIVWVKPLAPAGTAVLYECNLRGPV